MKQVSEEEYLKMQEKSWQYDRKYRPKKGNKKSPSISLISLDVTPMTYTYLLSLEVKYIVF